MTVAWQNFTERLKQFYSVEQSSSRQTIILIITSKYRYCATCSELPAVFPVLKVVFLQITRFNS